MIRRMPLLAATAALVVLPLTACSSDPFEDYCGAVEDHQTELTDLTAGGGPTALLSALDIFRDLQGRAPSDISDEWQQVVGRIEALEDALDAAGVDPASYDRDDPPAGLDEAERSRIEAAAAGLVSDETATAFQGLEQQARDVCQTPLTL